MSDNPYRTHTCNELRASHVGDVVRLSGWIHNKRDHGGLIFIDLRDRKGLTQCVIDSQSELFDLIDNTRIESVITVEGKVIARTPETINPNMDTGEIEVQMSTLTVQSTADVLPFQVGSKEDVSEELRLTYRYLDLRRERLHNNIKLRSNIINEIRAQMVARDFLEIQTPILTASSPEGARDFLVPSRRFPGKFYALPQAPQQFKQLLMVAGFERYFQIAPSFRDEDARADRSPGEFYQFDMEMSFCTQDDVFEAVESTLHAVFTKFSKGKTVAPMPCPRIPFLEAMEKYGSDKPDLRNPLVLHNVSDIFAGSGFKLFAGMIADKGAVVRAVKAPGASTKPRKYYDDLNDWARAEGYGGLGYIIRNEDGEFRGPIAKNLEPGECEALFTQCEAVPGDALFFVAGQPDVISKYVGIVRNKICDSLELRETDTFRFCWVVDFPMFEFDEKTQKIEFSHNPFSMPQGGLEALETMDPLEIKAFQYDIVCNGVELSSGAIRNHKPEIMYKAFEIAGYPPSVVDERFSGMISAFKFGAPPHGGCAPGIDRIVMLLAEEDNIREVIPFPMNQQAQDLMMQAPAAVTPLQLKELGITVTPPKKKPSSSV